MDQLLWIACCRLVCIVFRVLTQGISWPVFTSITIQISHQGVDEYIEPPPATLSLAIPAMLSAVYCSRQSGCHEMHCRNLKQGAPAFALLESCISSLNDGCMQWELDPPKSSMYTVFNPSHSSVFNASQYLWKDVTISEVCHFECRSLEMYSSSR
jgi:hypothetical protein